MTGIRTFQAAGVASAQGLDVSNYQGRYDWAGTRGLSFGINRVTQGLGAAGTNSPDPEASWNHAAIRDAGLARGAYHFLDPSLSGAAQARYFVDTLGHYGLVKNDMLWLDNETAGTSPGTVAACAQNFMAELHTLRPENPIGVYTYIDFAKQGNCAGLSKYALWLAYPAAAAPQPPPPWVKWAFWQWGLRNGVDADAFNGTAADLAAWIGSFRLPSGPTWQAWASDGKTSLGQLAADCGMWPSHILAATAQHAGGFDTVTANYVSAVFDGSLSPAEPIPVGATLWARK